MSENTTSNDTAGLAALAVASLVLAASLVFLALSLLFSAWVLAHPDLTVAGVALPQVVLSWSWYLAQVLAVPVAMVSVVTIAVKIRARRYF